VCIFDSFCLKSLPEYWWFLNALVAREWIQQENVLKE
jgi:hypothetical protein